MEKTWEPRNKVGANHHVSIVFVVGSISESVSLLGVVSGNGTSHVAQGRVVLPHPLVAIDSVE